MKDNYFQNRHILVTGGNGFLAGNLILKLVSMGANVTTICHRIPKDNILTYYDLANKINIEFGDITDYPFVAKVISDNEIQDIFHLAAVSIVRVASNNPIACLNTNIMGTVNILEAARQCGTVESVTVSASDKAYGQSPILPYIEEMALNGMSVYEASKSCTDIVTRMYAKNYDLPATVIRSANIFGGGDFNFSRIIPNNIIKRIKKEELIVYADVQNYVREFIYVDDAINAFLLLSMKISETKGEVYNIGSGDYDTIINVVYLLCQEVDRQLKRENEDVVISTPERNKYFREIEKQYLDCKKIMELGWKAEYDLVQGLEKTVNWYINYCMETYGWDI